MISSWLYLSSVFALSKSFLFLNSNFFLGGSSVFLISIMPLIWWCVNSMAQSKPFSHTDALSLKFFIFSVFFIFFFIVTLNDLVSFMVMVELAVFPMVFLILKFSKSEDKIISIFMMLSFNMLGSLAILIAAIFLSGSFVKTQPLFSGGASSYAESILFAMFIFMLLTKIPVVYVHFWLPKAHVSASGSVSMILASLMLKIGGFGLLKFMKEFYYLSLKLFSLGASHSFFGVALFTLLMARCLDLKVLVALSSVLHMSYIFPSHLSMSNSGFISSLLMMVGHGLISCYLFFLVSVLYETCQSRSVEALKMSLSNNKFLTKIFMGFLFLNLGVPPFICFYSELSYFLLILYMNSKIFTMLLALMLFASMFFTIFGVTKLLYSKSMNFSFMASMESLSISSLLYFLSFVWTIIVF